MEKKLLRIPKNFNLLKIQVSKTSKLFPNDKKLKESNSDYIPNKKQKSRPPIKKVHVTTSFQKN